MATSIADVFTVAIQFEEHARQGYADAALKVSAETTQHLLRDLASDEERHAAALRALMEEKLPPEQANAVVELTKLPRAPELPIAAEATEREIFQLAIEAEERAATFYEAMASWFDEGEVKDLLTWLVSQELTHKTLLKAELELLFSGHRVRKAK